MNNTQAPSNSSIDSTKIEPSKTIFGIDIDDFVETVPELDGLRDKIRRKNPSFNGILDHQKDFLLFFLEREGLCVDPNSQDKVPSSSRIGGIVADEMGLGKTIQCIVSSLCSDYYRTECEKDAPNAQSYLKRAMMKKRFVDCTLVICPSALLEQWRNEVLYFTNLEPSQVLIHNGNKINKKIDPAYIRENKVRFVITTYGMCSSKHEYTHYDADGKADGKYEDYILHRCYWRRLIADEGHNIRNESTDRSKRVCEIDCFFRWYCTGTPFNNTDKDIRTAAKFLRIVHLEGVDKEKWYKTATMEELTEWLSHFMIRRTKKILNLPKARNFVIEAASTPQELKIVDDIKKVAFGKFDVWEEAATHNERFIAQSKLLVALLRLKQICNDLVIVAEKAITDKYYIAAKRLLVDRIHKESLDSILCVKVNEDGTISPVPMSAADKREEEELLQRAEDRLNDVEKKKKKKSNKPKKKGSKKNLQSSDGNCNESEGQVDTNQELDDEELDLNLDFDDDKNRKRASKLDIVKQLIRYNRLAITDEKELVLVPSTKMWAFMSQLHKAFQEDINRKVVVFSQWTQTINLIDYNFNTYFQLIDNVKLFRFDVSNGREKVLDAFKEFEGGAVLLCNIESAACGLNLTECDMAFIFDQCYNPMKELQAKDRIDRIGQKKTPVIVRVRSDLDVEVALSNIKSRKLSQCSELISGLAPNEFNMDEVDNREIFASFGGKMSVEDARSFLEDLGYSKYKELGAEEIGKEYADALIKIDVIDSHFRSNPLPHIKTFGTNVRTIDVEKQAMILQQRKREAASAVLFPSMTPFASSSSGNQAPKSPVASDDLTSRFFQLSKPAKEAPDQNEVILVEDDEMESIHGDSQSSSSTTTTDTSSSDDSDVVMAERRIESPIEFDEEDEILPPSKKEKKSLPKNQELVVESSDSEEEQTRKPEAKKKKKISFGLKRSREQTKDAYSSEDEEVIVASKKQKTSTGSKIIEQKHMEKKKPVYDSCEDDEIIVVKRPSFKAQQSMLRPKQPLGGIDVKIAKKAGSSSVDEVVKKKLEQLKRIKQQARK